MPYLLSASIEITLMLFGLLILAIISWRRLDWGVSLVVLCLPFYLLKIKIGWVPSNILELMILVVGLVWLIKKVRGVERFGGVGEFKGLFFASLMILIGVVISTFRSLNIKVSAGILKGWFLAPIFFSLVLADTIKTKKQLKKFLAALVISGIAVAIVALWYFFHGRLTYDGRLSAFYLSPNRLAMYLVPIIIIAFGFFFNYFKSRRKYSLWFLEGGIVAMAVCLYLTYSYGAWLGLVGTLMIMMILNIFQMNKNKKFFIFYFLFFIFLTAILFFSQLGTEKFNNLLNFTRSSLQSRLVVWQAAWMMIKDYPVWGIGPGMFQIFYLGYQGRFLEPYLEWAVPQPHNIFLAFWLQAGLLGLAGFLWLLVEFFKKALRLRAGQRLANILIAVMIYIIVHGLTDTTYWKNDLAVVFWATIGLLVALDKISREKIQKQK